MSAAADKYMTGELVDLFDHVLKQIFDLKANTLYHKTFVRVQIIIKKNM